MVVRDAASATILSSVLGSATDILTSVGWLATKWPCMGNRLEAESDKENADNSALLHVCGMPCSLGVIVNFIFSVLDSTNILYGWKNVLPPRH